MLYLKTMTYTANYASPLGNLKIESSERGITSIQIVNQTAEIDTYINEHIRICILQLEEYFSGTRKVFQVPVDFSDAPFFYQEVWNTLMCIPYGKTRSYHDVAKRLGNYKAVRAVGVANAKNPIPIIVPCHRVIGKNGSLVGYAYGLKIKKQLLHLENPSQFNEQGVLFNESLKV